VKTGYNRYLDDHPLEDVLLVRVERTEQIRPRAPDYECEIVAIQEISVRGRVLYL
jgi:hypothetical protein